MKLSVSRQLLDLGQSAGLIGRVTTLAQGLYLYTNRKTHTTQILNIQALSGVQTHAPGVRASEDSLCLRPLGYRERHKPPVVFQNKESRLKMSGNNIYSAIWENSRLIIERQKLRTNTEKTDINVYYIYKKIDYICLTCVLHFN
jgi:hypothetical protein